MKAVLVDSKTTNLFTSFEIEKDIFKKEGIEFIIADVKTEKEYVDVCKDADALLLIGTRTTKGIIDSLEKCKVIVRYGVGYDVVDIESCSKVGIPVCNIPDAGTLQVAGHAFALALGCLRKITYYDRQIRRGGWNSGEGYTLHQYSWYTFGYCGFGSIGQAAANYAKGIGCKLIAYDPYVDDEVFRSMGVARAGFDELLAKSDVISIHTPLNEKTFHLFSAKEFSRMKHGAVVVNTSRGGVVDQEALLDAIDDGIVSAAGLDVNECEPLTDLNNRIFKYDTVILTPHSATESEEYFTTLQESVAKTAISVLNGELPQNTINREAIVAFRLEANKVYS